LTSLTCRGNAALQAEAPKQWISQGFAVQGQEF
jgi:hypothetical protein